MRCMRVDEITKVSKSVNEIFLEKNVNGLSVSFSSVTFAPLNTFIFQVLLPN